MSQNLGTRYPINSWIMPDLWDLSSHLFWYSCVLIHPNNHNGSLDGRSFGRLSLRCAPLTSWWSCGRALQLVLCDTWRIWATHLRVPGGREVFDRINIIHIIHIYIYTYIYIDIFTWEYIGFIYGILWDYITPYNGGWRGCWIGNLY